MLTVAILGAGSIAFGAAALLARQGHAPILWSPSGSGAAGLADAPLLASGVVAGVFHPKVAASCAEALAAADAVLLAVPGYGHRRVLETAAALLRPGQTVLYSSHMSLGALFLDRLLQARGVVLPIVAWGTTIVTGRRTGPAAVHVGSVRAQVDVAALNDDGRALALCCTLFGDRFVPRDGLLAIALSNLNPQNHLAIALCNLTRMEKGERWRQNAHITPAVARLMLALDAERLGLAQAFGLPVRTLEQHFHLSFDVPLTSMAEMAQELSTRDSDPWGPATLETRYVLEDLPFGIAPLLRIAEAAEMDLPLHRGGLAMFSALYGRYLAADNDLLPRLGVLDRAARAALKR